MEVIINYTDNQLNGFTTISGFTYYQGISNGSPSVNSQYLVVPINAGGVNQWFAFIYKYNADVKK
jgi:hypothetical protein